MYSLATKSSEKTNRRNYFTVSNMTKWHRNAGSILRRQWHSVRTQSTSGVYNRCKQTESSTVDLLSDSHAFVFITDAFTSQMHKAARWTTALL